MDGETRLALDRLSREMRALRTECVVLAVLSGASFAELAALSRDPATRVQQIVAELFTAGVRLGDVTDNPALRTRIMSLVGRVAETAETMLRTAQRGDPPPAPPEPDP